MTPWTVLGWILVGIVVVIAGLVVVAVIVGVYQGVGDRIRIRRKKSQAIGIDPAVGQRWVQYRDEKLRIEAITDGKLLVRSQFGHEFVTLERWRSRIKTRDMYLEADDAEDQ